MLDPNFFSKKVVFSVGGGGGGGGALRALFGGPRLKNSLPGLGLPPPPPPYPGYPGYKEGGALMNSPLSSMIRNDLYDDANSYRSIGKDDAIALC
jgi:hypothetical protein